MKIFLKKLFITLALISTCFLSFSSSTVQIAQANNQPPAAASSPTPAPTNPATELTETYQGIIQDLTAVLSVIVQTFNMLVWPILIMIGGLMDTSLIFGPGIEDRLLLVWAQFRNLINLLFAVFLIGVAIYNVLGLSKDGNYAIKKVLPSLIITLVLINFSFFGVKLVIDMSNVATTAVFALPNAVEQGFSEERISTIESALCNNNSISKLKSSNPLIQDLTQQIDQLSSTFKTCDGQKFSDNVRSQFQSLDKNNAALVMAISFGRIHQILEPSRLTTQDPSLINVAINLIIVLLLQIVYLSAFFTLFAVLVARIIALWLVLIASPFLVMQFTMQNIDLPGLSFLKSFKLDEMLITHVTAPIKIGLGMSVGYIMIDAFQSVGSPSLWYPIGDDFANAFSGINSIQELFMAIASIVIVWRVSVSAASGTFAETIVNKWSDFALGIGKKLREIAIEKVPVIPVSSGKDPDNQQKYLSLKDVGTGKDNLFKKVENQLDKIRGVDSSKASSNSIKSLEDIKTKILTERSKEENIRKLNARELEISAKSMVVDDDTETIRRFTALARDNQKAFKLLLASIKDKSTNETLKRSLGTLDFSKDIEFTDAQSKIREVFKSKVTKESLEDELKTLSNPQPNTN